MPDFFGTSGGMEQLTRFTPQQMQMFSQLLGGLGGAQSSGMDFLTQLLSGDEGAFAKFEDPFKRQFQQETVPGIAERFAGAGTHGATSSSGMQQSMAQAGKELTESLGSLRGNLQQNALSQLQGMMGMGFQPTFENIYKQPTMGMFGGLASGLGQGAGMMGGLQGLRALGVG